MLLSMVIAVVASILAVFFANHNQVLIEVNIFGFVVKGSLGVIIVVATGMGVLLGILTMLPALLEQSWKLIRSRRELEESRSTAKSSSPSNVPTP